MYFRPGRLLAPDAYYCADHAGPADLPLPVDPVCRRVEMVAGITLAGISLLHVPAQTEPVARLDAWVTSIGGRLEMRHVTSTLITLARQPAPQVANPLRGEG
ncbi:MAG TPA: hypothetical protein VGY48_12460 [Vicinamibacterales bacterium]|jgi:hypothetical protein|nr:hypothetical protein [Vicinamibacterales bacterium]